MHKRNLIAALVVTLMMLTACSDTSELETGGAAGDTQIDEEAVALVEPFAGIYDLPDNWSGYAPDEAFLEIREPDDQGVAVALLYDWDDIQNCLPARASEGRVAREPVGDRVFMDNILVFNQSVLSLQGNSLTISIPGEGTNLQAERLGVMMISDLGPTC